MQHPPTSPWFVRFHPAERSEVRLVCFPHAGGAASYYFPVSRELTSRTDVLAVQYPGRQDRHSEPHIEDLHTLADLIAAELGPWLDRPTAFFGHSMGAVLAFEVARRLERDNDFQALRVFVSGRRAPSTHREESVHRRDDDGVIAEMRALSGTNEAVFANEELLRMTLPTIRSDYKAVELYRPEPGSALRAPLTVLTGDADPRTTAEEAAAWQAHTTSTCEVRTYTGGHFFLTDHAGEIVRSIADALHPAGAGEHG
ncbi:thioesterase II family protein [Streptomyces sp. NPDC054841]